VLTFSYTKPSPLGSFEFVEIWTVGYSLFSTIGGINKKVFPVLMWSSPLENFNTTIETTGQRVAFFFASANSKYRRELVRYSGKHSGATSATVLTDPNADFIALYDQGTLLGDAVNDLIVNTYTGAMFTITSVISATELGISYVAGTGQGNNFTDGQNFILCEGPYDIEDVDGMTDAPGRSTSVKAYNVPQAVKIVATRRTERNIKLYNLYRRSFDSVVSGTGKSGKATSGTSTTNLKDSTAFTADASTDTITATAHGLSDGDLIRFESTGTLPAGLSTGTDYYVRDAATNTFKVSTTLGGSAVNITDAGTGTHTIIRFWNVAVNDLIYNITKGNYHIITAKNSNTDLSISLINGSSGFASGDSYRIYQGATLSAAPVPGTPGGPLVWTGTAPTRVDSAIDMQRSDGTVVMVDDATVSSQDSNPLINSEYIYYVSAVNTSDREGLPNIVYGSIAAEATLTPVGPQLLMNADLRNKNVWDNFWVLATTRDDEAQATSRTIELNSDTAYEDPNTIWNTGYAATTNGEGDVVHIEDGIRDLVVEKTDPPGTGNPRTLLVPNKYGGFSTFDHGQNSAAADSLTLPKNARIRLVGKKILASGTIYNHTGSGVANFSDSTRDPVADGVRVGMKIYNDTQNLVGSITAVASGLGGQITAAMGGNWANGDKARVLDILYDNDFAIWRMPGQTSGQRVKFANDSEIYWDNSIVSNGDDAQQRIVIRPMYPYADNKLLPASGDVFCISAYAKKGSSGSDGAATDTDGLNMTLTIHGTIASSVIGNIIPFTEIRTTYKRFYSVVDLSDVDLSGLGTIIGCQVAFLIVKFSSSRDLYIKNPTFNYGFYPCIEGRRFDDPPYDFTLPPSVTQQPAQPPNTGGSDKPGGRDNPRNPLDRAPSRRLI
jgi:hypothetical protein